MKLRFAIATVLLIGGTPLRAAAPAVTVGPAIRTMPARFFGLHYNGPTHRAVDPATGLLADLPSSFADPGARAALQEAGIGAARVFLDAPTVNPSLGVFDWADTDTAVGEIVAAGMRPMLTLHQRDGAWHVGDSADPWWNHAAGRQSWRELAAAVATRYGGVVTHIEFLNEPNHLHRDRASYMGFDRSADLFLDGASEVRSIAPGVKLGGPASFRSWEPATWAKRVLARPGGEGALDFVSYHLYASGSLGDSDAEMFEFSRLWQTIPATIREELTPLTDKPIEIALTEYNASSVWQSGGVLVTDDRNTNVAGGLLSALGALRSAEGGADVAIRFATTGGFGLVRWPPEYELLPAYHATRLVHERGGLSGGAVVRQADLPAGASDRLDAFAIDGDQRAILLTNTDDTAHAVSLPPSPTGAWDLYRFDSERVELARDRIGRVPGGELALPSRSLTVVRAAALPGDHNADGLIDGSDYDAWVASFGTAGTDLGADGNADGVVDAADYTRWRDATAGSNTRVVPEPTTPVAFAVASALTARRSGNRPTPRSAAR